MPSLGIIFLPMLKTEKYLGLLFYFRPFLQQHLNIYRAQNILLNSFSSYLDIDGKDAPL